MSDAEEAFDKIMDGFPTEVSLSYASYEPGDGDPDQFPTPKEVTVVLSFSEKGFGFGSVCIKQTTEGVFLDTEHMSLARVKKYFNMLLDSAVTDVDQDPARHALYNRVMQQQCGKHCKVCFGV